jgi:hypothetical protein
MDEGPAVRRRPSRPPTRWHQFTEEARARARRSSTSTITSRATIVNRMGLAAKIAHRRQLKKLAEEQEGK